MYVQSISHKLIDINMIIIILKIVLIPKKIDTNKWNGLSAWLEECEGFNKI